MVSRDDDTVVLWPRYFDARLTRAEGRRVPKDLAVKDPDAKWIDSAARKVGLETTLEEDKHHPSLPYKGAGRVLVKKTHSKESILRSVAKVLSS